MLVYALRRILLSIPVLFAVLLITFTLGYFGPGDPVTIQFGIREYDPDPEAVARLRHRLGLDRPFWVQFGDYMWNLVRGDMGKSLRGFNLEIRPKVKRAFPITFQLGAAASVLLVAVGIPLGVLAAVRQNTWVDYWIVGISIAVRSIHIIVFAPMLMIIFVLWLDLMKTPIGWHGLFHQSAIMPVFLLAVGPLLIVVRQTRTGVLEVIRQNYVRTARAKGMVERRVITRHMMKNALTPMLTSMGLVTSGLVTGSLFVELIFGIPGLAGIGIDAFRARDYPMILAATIIGATIIVVANLMVDLCYGLLDPRVRYE
jgi:ABC-type dipeptide/oligopeptide/nickel transport system permease component